MGATNIHYSRWSSDARTAYNELVEEARDEYGNNAYNGTITTTSGFFMAQKPKDDDEYDKLLDSTEKWGDCACYVSEENKEKKLKLFTFIGWASI